MNGMEMMMKGMGLDPTEIKTKFEGFQKQMSELFQHFDAQQKVIIKTQDEILQEIRAWKKPPQS